MASRFLLGAAQQMDWRPGGRAHRYGVSWPVRVRRVDEAHWHRARTVNLSVTGVLLRTYHRFPVGDRVELQIEFLTNPAPNTVVASVGHVVREDSSVPGGTAIQFLTSLPPIARA